MNGNDYFKCVEESPRPYTIVLLLSSKDCAVCEYTLVFINDFLVMFMNKWQKLLRLTGVMEVCIQTLKVNKIQRFSSILDMVTESKLPRSLKRMVLGLCLKS